MTQLNNVPPIIVLSAANEGNVLSRTSNGESLSLLDHDKELAIISVPVLLVEQPLVYKDYALYLIQNEDDLEAKIDNIQQQEQNALILVGNLNIRKAYFIENNSLFSSKPLEIDCELYLYIIEQFRINNNGKVICHKSNTGDIERVIGYIRNSSNLGNEAGIAKTRTGRNVYSKDFGPCNPVIGLRKIDKQFVIAHLTGTSVARNSGAIGDFVESIESGQGSYFTIVMQNPKVYKSHLKAPTIAGKLAVLFNDENVSRISVAEGYSGVACINSTTIIVTNEMHYFRNETEKKMLVNRYSSQELGAVRILDMEKELISMTSTRHDIQKQYETEKDNPLLAPDYVKLLHQLGVFKVEEKKSTQDQQEFGADRIIDMEKELISMTSSGHDIQKQHETEKDNPLLAPDHIKLLHQLGVFKVEEKKSPQAQSEQSCCLLM